MRGPVGLCAMPLRITDRERMAARGQGRSSYNPMRTTEKRHMNAAAMITGAPRSVPLCRCERGRACGEGQAIAPPAGSNAGVRFLPPRGSPRARLPRTAARMWR